MSELLGRDKKWETVGPSGAKKTGEIKTRGPAPIGARKGVFSHGKGFHVKAHKNRLAIRSLNRDIITWQQLGRTVLVFQAGSHLWVQSRMPVTDTVVNPVVRRG